MTCSPRTWRSSSNRPANDGILGVVNDTTPADDGVTVTEPTRTQPRAFIETGDPAADELLTELHALTGVSIVPVERQPKLIHTVAYATHSGSLEQARTVETITDVAARLAANLVDTANLIREVLGDVSRSPVPPLRYLTDDDLRSTAIIMISGVGDPDDGTAGEAVVDYLLHRVGSTDMVPLVIMVNDPAADLTAIDLPEARRLLDALADRLGVDPAIVLPR